MAFSRMAAAQAKAAMPAAAQDSEALAWKARLAEEQQEQASSAATASQVPTRPAVSDAKHKAVAEDARWKETHQMYNANLADAACRHKRAQQQIDEEKARQLRIERSKAEAAKRATGSSGGFQGGGFGTSGGRTDLKKGYPVASSASSFGARDSPHANRGDLPSHDDCELAVSAMISRTTQGMKEGLQGLGLPDYPMRFVPGKELLLCGHDVREVVNEMIHAWMTEEKEDFYNVLMRIRGVVANPILTEEEQGMMKQHASHEALWGKPRTSGLADPKAKQKIVSPADVHDDSEDEVIDLSSTMPARQEGSPRSFAHSFAKPGPPTAPAPAAASPPVAAATSLEDHYGLLGIPQTATLQEIRLQFRKLVVTEHPEKGGEPKKFAKLNKAYGVLSDHEKRRQYNEQLAMAAGGKRFVD